MKGNKAERLLQYLRDNRKDTFVSANELSAYLGVSTRQVRKYVVKINEETKQELILSSNKGYRMDYDAYTTYQETKEELRIETPETRKNYIIQKLVSCCHGYDIFDFADELYVSNATIETDLKNVRSDINSFALQLKRDKNMIFLVGEEKNKRNLMRSLITSDTYDNFVLKDEVQILTFHYHFWDFRKNINSIFAQNDIFANDYTLNNTALHLIITIDRIRNHCELKEQIDLEKVIDTPQYRVAKSISEYIETEYKVQINDAELYNLILIISNNTTIMDYSFINPQNINTYIEQKYIDIAHQVIRKVEDCYHLDPFDEEFIAKFTIHVKNLFNRVEHHYFAKNPLTQKIKTTYPLIYDIAVFIAQEFDKDYAMKVNEDEIAFIAFHIGSYFENNVQSANKLSCLFIYADYYSIHQKLLDQITKTFSSQINMKAAVSIHAYDENLMHADLIISTVSLPFHVPHVLINPFLTEKDIRNIRNSVDHMINQNRNAALKAYLLNFFHEELFYIDIKGENKQAIITSLAQDVVRLGYANDSFTEDVLAREEMSSTAFHTVAVPHSLSKNAKRSFISIALQKEPIAWGKHEVSMIALIGVNDDSRKLFSQVFDNLIDILSEPVNVKELTQASSFQEFISMIMVMMDHVYDV